MNNKIFNPGQLSFPICWNAMDLWVTVDGWVGNDCSYQALSGWVELDTSNPKTVADEVHDSLAPIVAERSDRIFEILVDEFPDVFSENIAEHMEDCRRYYEEGRAAHRHEEEGISWIL